MSEALIGVVLGGLIAWVAPLVTLHYSERKWKMELLVAHLTSERDRAETMYERVLADFGKAMVENSYPSNMTSDLLVFAPKDVLDVFTSFMADKPKTEEKCKSAYLALAAAMKRDLRSRELEVRELLGAP
jgi:hypothetical protein